VNLAGFQAVCDEGWRRVSSTPGYLAEREARFLMLAAAGAPADGAIVEIGSFKGRSTVGLAYVAQRYGLGNVVAIDPHTAPSTTDPDLGAQRSSYDEFQESLRRAGVADAVDCRRAFSHEVARTWTRPIRLLWIDGDHVYESVKQDLALFRPYLAPGAIVALHDVLGTWPGPLRVFVEDVLGSDAFGPAGCFESIGWAQYRPEDGGAWRFRWRRQRLAAAARWLIPVAQAGWVTTGLGWWRHKLVEAAAAWRRRSRPVGRAGGDQVAAPEPARYCGRRGTRGGPMPEQLIGTVVHYFKGPSVAVVRVTEGTLAVGDQIRFHGHTTDFTEQIASMEVNHQKVPLAKAGDEVAIQVADRTRQHDQVFKVTP